MRDVRQLASLPDDFQNAAKGETRPGRAKPAAPFSLRLSAQERALLEREAGSIPLGAHIRFRLFAGTEAPRRASRRPSVDEQGIARVLAALGDSRLASNLNQLAKAANLGVLPATQQTEQELLAACEDVRAMRKALFAALGLKG